MISPPPPLGEFSPPSIPGTPEQQGTPGWLPQWRQSDHEKSPHQANQEEIQIHEINHLQTRPEEPIIVRTTPESSVFKSINNLSRCSKIIFTSTEKN